MADELRFMVHSGQVTVSGFVSAHARPVMHTLKVYGTRDSVELDYAARTLVYSARQTQPSAIGRLFPAWTQARRFARNGWRNVKQFRRSEFHYFQCMRVLLDRFYDAVEVRGPDPISHEQILRVCRLIDQVVVGMGKSA
jgi:predicted dehydrogenase